MRKYLQLILSLLALQTASSAFASDLGINVILSGQVSPGVYGQVEIGDAPRPRVVYEQPRVIVVDKRYTRYEPIYLHVPPSHASHWDNHCHSYNACGRRVYFVKSAEYEPEYRREHDHRDHHDHHRDHHNDHHRDHHNDHHRDHHNDHHRDHHNDNHNNHHDDHKHKNKHEGHGRDKH